ncbi:tetratricopeptide repeat protein 32 [Hypomesus transpacificus]|uniref:tetratricopeptide repeat protein 32 n=1 Tax=Hypomesus transpacificus TaxID=137520 RepID=UPI001F07253A|nr:tetratricopeptide repeat protein 32 [Hypomesus transpacificus]
MEQDTQTLEHAHVEFKKRNFKQAEDLYTTFISSCLQTRKCEAGALASALNNRGQIKYFRVDFNEAIEDYTSAIKANSQFEIPFYNRGLIHYRLGFSQKAEHDFKRVLELNANFEDAKTSLKQTLLDRQHKIDRGY